MQVLLRAHLVVRALDPDLLARRDGAAEDAAEGVEAALVARRHHLGNVHHQRAGLVASPDGLGRLIVHWALVQVLDTVLLRHDRRGKLRDDHVQEGVRRVDPDLHGALHQRLAGQVLIIALQGDAQGLHHLLVLLLLVLDDRSHQLVDRGHDELAESTGQRLGAPLRLHHVRPSLLLRIKEAVAPQALHHLLLVDAHLRGVDLREALHVETPSVEAAAECHGALLGGHLDVAHKLIVVGGDDHIHVLDGLSETTVHVFGLHLQLEDATVHLVDEEARAHTLGQRLAQHGFRLHRAALNAVHDDHGAVCDAQGRGHLGGEVHVTGGIDEVDQVRLASRAVILVILEVQGHAGAFDRHATLLLVRAGVCEAGVARLLRRNDARLADQRVSQRGLAVIDVRDNAHGTDVFRLVHDRPDLIDGEVRHVREYSKLHAPEK
mmetsp:Transcript_104771/g.301505  ORF Transcript_104771/g.301505 Transcript_104771/m.301505 type:complete len:435 (-) Transcript_104771:52-1356(-)